MEPGLPVIGYTTSLRLEQSLSRVQNHLCAILILGEPYFMPAKENVGTDIDCGGVTYHAFQK